MQRKKITQDILDRMTTLRKQGYSYRQIRKEIAVSEWACINYLRNVKMETGVAEVMWKKAEEEAAQILENNGFSHIVNLNELCPSPHWDYYAEKDNEKFLIDVTINQSKNLIDKALRRVEGYNHVVLLKMDKEWKFIEIHLKETIIT